MARAYVAKHPSQHPSIRWAGRHLADFLATEAPYRDDPWFADMARFDWALAFAFDAADAPAAGLADLVGVPPEFWGSIRLALPSDARRIPHFDPGRRSAAAAAGERRRPRWTARRAASARSWPGASSTT